MRSCGKFRVRIPEIGGTETKEIRGAEFTVAGVERGRVVPLRNLLHCGRLRTAERRTDGDRTSDALIADSIDPFLRGPS